MSDRDRDRQLLQRMKILSFLNPDALDVKPALRNELVLNVAQDELRKINNFITPADKV